MSKKILMFCLFPFTVNAHDTVVSSTSSLNFIEGVLHALTHAHHAYGGLLFVAVAFLMAKLLRKTIRKQQTIENKKSH